jgi:hypothetical protein
MILTSSRFTMSSYSEKSMNFDAASVRSTSTMSSLKSLFKKDKSDKSDAAKAAAKTKKLEEKAVHREAMYTYMTMR